MASIYKRMNPSGTVSIRVVFRFRGMPHFTITFDDWDQACSWAEEHEPKFIKNPDEYMRWRENMYLQMKRDGSRLQDHIRIMRTPYAKKKFT